MAMIIGTSTFSGSPSCASAGVEAADPPSGFGGLDRLYPYMAEHCCAWSAVVGATSAALTMPGPEHQLTRGALFHLRAGRPRRRALSVRMRGRGWRPPR